MKLHLCYLILFNLILSSCSIFGFGKLSKKECENMDWSTAGKSDALKGLNKTQLDKMKKECLEYKIKVNEKKYHKGFNIGLSELCSFEGGYELGTFGRKYKGTCSKKTEKELLRGYRIGYKQYELEQELLQTREQLDITIEELDQTKNELEDTKRELEDAQSDSY